ncbi:MAG: hypothetical protein OXH51_10570 [Gemmatimonadetes bacterium]|nr:hypothetical protein [Gemmatimonadota bacterium]
MDETVRDIFTRFNKNLSPASRQEIRNARFTGPFITLSEELADDPFWVASTLVTPASVRRMKDVEFVSDLLIGMMYGPQAGNAATLDRYYERLEGFRDDGRIPEQSELRKIFIETRESVHRILPEIKGNRWGNRTDFYSLFVAIAEVEQGGATSRGKEGKMREWLLSFSERVNDRLKDERKRASEDVVEYVRAVEKGANDKSRRTARHRILTKAALDIFE